MSKRIVTIFALCLMTLSSIVIGVSSAGSSQNVHGKITQKAGNVTVDGQPAAVNSDVNSGSTTTTAKGSSAVVSLGKLGRVEVMESTTTKLTYADSSLTAMLDAGRVRLSTPASATATVKTDDAEIVTVQKRAKEFTVDVTCGDTLVSVQKGTVELRAGTAVKQIAAGSQDTAGTATPGCRR
jgi:hypothetical protein